MEMNLIGGLMSLLFVMMLVLAYIVTNATRLCVKEQRNKKNYLVLKFKYSFKSDELRGVLIEQKESPEHGTLYYANGLTKEHVEDYIIFAGSRITTGTQCDISLDDFLATGEYIHNIIALSRVVNIPIPDVLQKYSAINLAEVINWLTISKSGSNPIIAILPNKVILDFEDSIHAFRRYICLYNKYDELITPFLNLERVIKDDKLTRP